MHLLTPTTYDPATMCASARAGCIGFPRPSIDTPCSNQGYCVPSTVANDPVGPFTCQCKVYEGTANVGVSLAGQPRYIGRACQYEIATGCTGTQATANGIQSVFCSGYVDRCYADAVWSGIGVFDPTNQASIDYVPRCHCANDDSNPYPAIGTFCESSRCGDNQLRCSSQLDSSNLCLATSERDSTNTNNIYRCSCGDKWIGSQCQYSAASCLYNGRKCSGRGECVTRVTGAVINNTTELECRCFGSGTYFGQWCQFQACTESVLVPGHGECSDNVLTRCYRVYHGAACQTDSCAAHGNGTIDRLRPGETEPTRCNCPTGWNATFAGSGDPSCWPLCPVDANGATCGGSVNKCQLAQDASGQRTATCVCGFGFIPVQQQKLGAPIGVNQTSCEAYCIHGQPDPTKSWDYRNPSSCLCVGTGFNTANSRPRCDNPVCANGGTYTGTANSDSCLCRPPFLAIDHCVSHDCNRLPRPEGYTKGFPVATTFVNGTNGHKCFCDAPFLPIEPSMPFDCDGNICGSHGRFNLAWNRIQPVISMCTCIGQYRSTCSIFTDVRTCSMCATSTCLNGGYASTLDSTVCTCPFPFANGAQNRCDTTQCSRFSIGYNATSCICMDGYAGQICDVDIGLLPLGPGSVPVGSSSSSSTGVGVKANETITRDDDGNGDLEPSSSHGMPHTSHAVWICIALLLFVSS